MFSTLSEINEYTSQEVTQEIQDPTPSEANKISPPKPKGLKGKFKKTPANTQKIATSHVEAKEYEFKQAIEEIIDPKKPVATLGKPASPVKPQVLKKPEIDPRALYVRFKPCHNIKQQKDGSYTKCTYEGCTYAHYIEELRAPRCRFDKACRNAYCKFLHSGEEGFGVYQRVNGVLPKIPWLFDELMDLGMSKEEAHGKVVDLANREKFPQVPPQKKVVYVAADKLLKVLKEISDAELANVELRLL